MPRLRSLPLTPMPTLNPYPNPNPNPSPYPYPNPQPPTLALILTLALTLTLAVVRSSCRCFSLRCSPSGSPPHLPYISPIFPLYLPYISLSPLYLAAMLTQRVAALPAP